MLRLFVVCLLRVFVLFVGVFGRRGAPKTGHKNTGNKVPIPVIFLGCFSGLLSLVAVAVCGCRAWSFAVGRWDLRLRQPAIAIISAEGWA